MGETDVALMLRFKDGDVSAFDEIVQRHKKPLINFFYRFLWDIQLAEDSAQEVLYRLFRAAKRYKPQSKFNTFLYRIASHYLSDQLRKQKKNPSMISLDEPLPDKDGRATDLHEKIADAKMGPLKRLEQEELSSIIKKAIFALPIKQRRVFILCENQGLRYEEVATILKIPVGTVKSRMYKATRLLREELRELKGE